MGVTVRELENETLYEYWKNLAASERSKEKIVELTLEMLLAVHEVHESIFNEIFEFFETLSIKCN